MASTITYRIWNPEYCLMKAKKAKTHVSTWIHRAEKGADYKVRSDGPYEDFMREFIRSDADANGGKTPYKMKDMIGDSDAWCTHVWTTNTPYRSYL